MPRCLSLLFSRDPERLDLVLDNHRTYCSQMGYGHAVDDAGHVQHPDMMRLYTLHAARRELARMPQGELLMLLTSDSAVYRGRRLEDMMEGRSALHSAAKPQGEAEPDAQLNWLVFRNEPQTHATLGRVIHDFHRKLFHADARSWRDICAPLGGVDYYAQLLGQHLNINWRLDAPNWFAADIFIVNALPEAFRGVDGRYDRHSPLSDPKLGTIVLGEAHKGLRGLPVMQLPEYPPISDAPLSAWNTGSPIALISLYTHHVACYGRISEHNVKRYCDRHGIAYYVYREIPEGMDPAINGTWHKAWLLERHFDQHEWVIWIDADTLFVNQSIPLADVLAGKDMLLAKDIADWEFNAGVMGFRRTPENLATLHHIQRRITAIEDKSSVYASGGDQQQSIFGLLELGRLSPGTVGDFLSANTPPQLRSKDSLLVHYMGIGDGYRTLYMARDDAMSKARG